MSDEFQPGDTLGDYRLDVRLGGGGFGSVWKATERATGRVVALKVLRTDVYSSDTTRLRSEVELLAATASSRSPHVVKVFGGGSEPSPYVVMEFIDGVDLGRELERRKRIPQLETIRIGAAVANALSALELVGIIHRDIKPANVMIDVDGVVKLTDFGIAKIVGFDTITATSQMPMSMAYAAPEVWEGSASHQSDLYSLGVLLFQCLAGRPPFTGSYAQVYRQHATKDPDWSLLPEGTVASLRDLLRDCLAKAESDRPANAAVVTERLDEAERELAARLQSAAAPDLPIHEPQAFGPWLRRGKHPTQDWAFLCIHETTGKKATVEIHFSDDIEYGARLRKAVEVNPKLVPLGAEGLLGTNRLVLRPGEAWSDAPLGQFQFWVAREELPLRPSPTVADESMLRSAAAALTGLSAAAELGGLALHLPPSGLHLMPDGSVLLSRPGLASMGDDGIAWLRGLPLDEPTKARVMKAADMNALVVNLAPSVGLANEASRDEAPEASDSTAMFPTALTTSGADERGGLIEPGSPLSTPSRQPSEIDSEILPPEGYPGAVPTPNDGPRGLTKAPGHDSALSPASAPQFGPASRAFPLEWVVMGIVAFLTILVVGTPVLVWMLSHDNPDPSQSTGSTEKTAKVVSGDGTLELRAFDNYFVPASFRVDPGATLTVRLTRDTKSLVPHGLQMPEGWQVEDGAAEFIVTKDSTEMTARWRVPDIPGEYEFSCPVHPPEMRGRIFVSEPTNRSLITGPDANQFATVQPSPTPGVVVAGATSIPPTSAALSPVIRQVEIVGETASSLTALVRYVSGSDGARIVLSSWGGVIEANRAADMYGDSASVSSGVGDVELVVQTPLGVGTGCRSYASAMWSEGFRIRLESRDGAVLDETSISHTKYWARRDAAGRVCPRSSSEGPLDP